MNTTFQSSKTLTISNELGLHARAATRMAQMARQAESNIWIIKSGQKADASSVLDILMLACPQGTEITLGIEDAADEDVLNKIAKLIKDGFGE
ncbi:phosphocarrier protein HPr [Candidatus Magnetomoraceae bacterium gMMP-15]